MFRSPPDQILKSCLFEVTLVQFMVRGNNVSVDGHISSSSPVVHLVLMCSMESVQCWHKCVKCFSTKYEKSIVSLDEKIIEDHNTFQLRITQK